MARDPEVFDEAAAESLKRSLQPLSPGGGSPLSPAVERYLAHYGIDFADLQSRHVFGKVTAAGLELATHVYHPRGQARGTFIILHGLFDHAGIYGHVIRFCLEQQYAVCIADLPGHGLSGGEPADIDEFSRYREVVKEWIGCLAPHELPAPFQMLGQSMGGAIAMDCVLHWCRHSPQEPLQQGVVEIDRLFLLAPLLRPVEWLRVRFYHWIGHHFRSHIEREFTDNSRDEVFLRFLREQDPLQPRRLSGRWVRALVRWQRQFRRLPPCSLPVRMFQGDDDGTVNWRWNLPRIHGRFPQLSVTMLPGGRHHLANESAGHRRRMFAVMADDLKPPETC
ncbi:MAG: alpha/beta hydrolase [Pseudohongiellaceae bacterium]